MISESFIENNFPKGVVTLVGARPAMGKTAFALSLAINLARNNRKFIYFCMDMDRKQAMSRIAKQIDEKEYAAIEERIIMDNGCPLEISMVRKRLEELPVDYVIIDYLQLLISGKKEESRRAGLSFLMQELKEMAKEFQVAIIVLSQSLHRRYRTLKDFDRSCFDDNDLSADDLEGVRVAFLHREEYYGLREYDSNGNVVPGCTMFIVCQEEMFCVTYLHFNHETLEMSMRGRN